MLYIIPAGKTRQFSVHIKLDDNSLVVPDTIEFSLSDEHNFSMAVNTYRAYVHVNADKGPGIQGHLIVNATHVHASRTYRYTLDVLIVTGAVEAPAPADTDVTDLGLTVGAAHA